MKLRRWFIAGLVLLLMLSCCACGSESRMTMDAVNEEVQSGSGLYESGSVDSAVDKNRKLILTVKLSAETENLDDLLEWLIGRVADLSGYVEEQTVYYGSRRSTGYRSADMVIRIPAEQVDGFLEDVEGKANLISRNLSREDVTLSYVDTESRLNALRVQETRLLELLAGAESMSDLLEIESKLTDVRYEIENVTSRLRTYDNLVDYATVNLSVSEVVEYTRTEEPSVWSRIGSGFVSSVKGVWELLVDLFVFVIVASPYLVVIGGVVVLVIVLRKKRKHRKSKAESHKDEQADGT